MTAERFTLWCGALVALGLLGCSEEAAAPDAGRALPFGQVEWCNGRDDDGDGRIDQGFDCEQGRIEPCALSCGGTGARRCSVACTWATCAPPPETCNGRDDDCDGSIDEGFECPADSRGYCPRTGLVTGGLGVCGPDCRWASCEPLPAELCNGLDDDGDGATDEDRVCIGIVQEVCNYVDDDGDGRVDEGFDYTYVLGPVELEAFGPARDLRSPTRCTDDRVALHNWGTWSEDSVRFLSPDGRWLGEFDPCPGEETGVVDMQWSGADLIVACGAFVLLDMPGHISPYRGDISMYRYDREGQLLSGPIELLTQWGDYEDGFSLPELAIGSQGFAYLYTQGMGGDAHFELQLLEDTLLPDGPPIPLDIPMYLNNQTFTFSDVRVRWDEQGGWAIFNLEPSHTLPESRGLFLHHLDPRTRQLDQGIELLPGRGVIGAVEKFDGGWGIVGSSGGIYIINEQGRIVGNSIIPGGWEGAQIFAPTVDVPVPAGVANGQFIVALPGWSSLTRFSLDGRMNGASRPEFDMDFCEDCSLGGRVGCLMPDGRMILVWEVDDGMGMNTNRRAITVTGCPSL